MIVEANKVLSVPDSEVRTPRNIFISDYENEDDDEDD